MIDARSFAYCSSLAAVKLPPALDYLGIEAFRGCSSLEELTFPTSLTSLGANVAILADNLKAFNVEEGNSLCSSKDGLLYNKDGTSLYMVPCGKDGSLNIPNGVSAINNDAFMYCRRLTEIVIPETVTEIGSRAFYNCSELNKINIPNGIMEIGRASCRERVLRLV